MNNCCVADLGISFQFEKMEIQHIAENSDTVKIIRRIVGIPEWAELLIHCSMRDIVTCIVGKDIFKAYLGIGALIEVEPTAMPRMEKERKEAVIDEKLKAVIERALASGFRVELLRDKDGNIIAQTIQRKRLKTE